MRTYTDLCKDGDGGAADEIQETRRATRIWRVRDGECTILQRSGTRSRKCARKCMERRGGMCGMRMYVEVVCGVE